MLKPILIAALLFVAGPGCAFGAGKRATLGEEFKAADADRNDLLSRAEAERTAPRLAKAFDAIDANRDGQIGPEEIRVWRRTAKGERRAKTVGADTQVKFDRHFSRADTDGDGTLSRAEAEQGLPRVAAKFDRIDKDGNGRVTREEMRAWLDARRAARGGKEAK
jgi:Ca2+-binding EF-hand superfamily protein